VKQTVSVGVATWDHQEAPDGLERRADLAMYEAKRHGRNCVAVAPDAARITRDPRTALRRASGSPSPRAR
jgi:predicted signal transduction protein with EAL and GGDEF domain